VSIPSGIYIEESLADAERFDAESTREVVPASLLELPSCEGVDDFTESPTDMLTRIPSCGEQARYDASWGETDSSVTATLGWELECFHRGRDRRCWRFTGRAYGTTPVTEYGTGNVGDAELRFYSPFQFPIAFPPAEDDVPIHPSVFDQGRGGEPAPVIIVRRLSFGPTQVDGIPEEVINSDGRVDCADVYHGNFVRTPDEDDGW
jgi:hypothetical protein